MRNQRDCESGQSCGNGEFLFVAALFAAFILYAVWQMKEIV